MKGVILMKKVQTYLPEDTARMIERNAKKELLPKSSYCRSIILQAVRSFDDGAVCNADVPVAEMYNPIHVHFGGKEAIALRRKAARLHLNQAEWARNILLRKNRTIYLMELDDLGTSLDLFDRLENVLAAVRSAGWKQKAFRYDLELISDFVDTICAHAALLLEDVFKKRTKEQKRLTKRYLESGMSERK